MKMEHRCTAPSAPEEKRCSCVMQRTVPKSTALPASRNCVDYLNWKGYVGDVKYGKGSSILAIRGSPNSNNLVATHQ